MSMATRTRSASLATVALTAALAAPPRLAAQATVSIQTIYSVETIFVADFSPYNVGQQPDFLQVTIMNGLGRAQNVRLKIVIRQERPTPQMLFTGTTKEFVLSGSVRLITNRDLADQKSDVVIRTFEIGATRDIQDKMAQTGRFPSGTYVFEAHLTSATGVPLSDSQTRVDLVNPTRIELQTPGSLFGNQPEVVTTPSPRFQWTADEGLVGSLGSYKLRVVPTDAAASAEEAMQGFASWETVTTATTAVYPGAASAIQLVPGRTYAWQVTRAVKTSGGTQSITSPIYWFKMSGGTETAGGGSRGSGGNVGVRLGLNQLGQGLGLGNQLTGFNPTGQMVVDGRSVSFDNLEALLQAILSGQVTVRSVTVH